MNLNKLVDEISDINSPAILYKENIKDNIAEIIRELNKKKIEVFYLDEHETIDSGEKLMNSFYHQAKFPDFFGGNWNAVDECINNYDYLPAEGYIFIFIKPSILKEKSTQNFSILIEVMQDASIRWKEEEGKLFKLILGEKVL